jgi:hypothetical protein
VAVADVPVDAVLAAVSRTYFRIEGPSAIALASRQGLKA